MSADLYSSRTLLIIGVTAILPILTGCRIEGEPKVELASLENTLPILEARAREWQPDAHLLFASVSILTRDCGQGANFLIDGTWERGADTAQTAISGMFISPTYYSEAITVSIDCDGSMRTYVDSIRGSPLEHEPITEDEWVLDTISAFEAGMNEEGQRFLMRNTDRQCSDMDFRRDDFELRGPLVWIIKLETCGLPLGETFQKTTIDAMTGEVLRQEAFELSPGS